MQYTVLLTALAAVTAWQGVRYFPYTIRAEWAAVAVMVILVYAVLSFLVAAALYAVTSLTPTQAGTWLRRPDGRIRFWSLAVLLAPYMAFTWLLLAIMARLPSRPAAHEVDDGLVLGRRPMPGDRAALAPFRIDAVLDLCAEVPETRWLRAQSDGAYRCIPVLDITVPRPDQLEEAVAWLAEQRESGRRILVHCAVGYGRSALAVACFLLAAGRFATLPDALVHLLAHRPGVTLNPAQHRAAERFLAGELERRSTP